MARTCAEAVGGQLLGSCQEVASCAVDHNIQAAVPLHCLLHRPFAVCISPHIALMTAHKFSDATPTNSLRVSCRMLAMSYPSLNPGYITLHLSYLEAMSKTCQCR